MITADDNGQKGCYCLANIVLVELTQLLILLRYRHTLQIAIISYSLKIPTNQEDIHLISMFLLQLRYVSIYGVQLSMAAPFNSNLRDGSS